MPRADGVDDSNSQLVTPLTTAGFEEKDRLPQGPEAVSKPSSLPTQACHQEFEFPGDVASVASARDEVMEFVAEHCRDEGDQIDILVALQEALANAALHGCGDDATKRVHCAVDLQDSDITLTVRDPGPGFDLAMADPKKYETTTLNHGRGICLMRSLVSEVSFAHNGAEIKLRKRIHGGE